MRGKTNGHVLVAVVLAEDRETVLAHVFIVDDGEEFNYDTGEMTYKGRRVPQGDLKADQSEKNVQDLIERTRWCAGRK